MWRESRLAARLAVALAFVATVACAEDELDRSGGPYVPTPQIVVDQMLRFANVGADDYVMDLGSGDGVIVLTAAERYRALERELARIRETLSEADVLAARAEEIRRAADAIIAGLAERELPLAADLAVYEARVAERAAARPSERVSEAEREEARAASAVVAARGVLQAAIARTATLRGRSEAAAAAEDRLSELRASLAATARETAAASVLVRAWRDLRVSVLETAVIPSVEQTANEILRRFPYGLSIALATSRATAAGERETLDVTVLGGRAPLYEGASGGQRTAIDVALHVAIALVVSRRATTRLRYLFADEPEGLDDAGRAAFATVARWAAEELGLTVVVASHAADLVDALGGRRYEVPS